MQLMSDRTEKAVRLLTVLAKGDVSLVHEAMKACGSQGVQKVMEYIVAKPAAAQTR